MTDSPAVVWSCGGGTQSAAIAALICSGALPRPDASVIADTGREASETWRYLESVLQPNLKRAGVELVRLPHSFDGSGWNKVDVLGGKNKRTALVPAFTTHGATGGALTPLARYCSNEWKARPVERYYRSLGLNRGVIWIGFTIDEFHRMRSSNPAARWNHSYPLVDRRMTRGDCVSLVESMGWPAPPRSACWMCPYRTDAEWLHLKATDPEDFDAAARFEKSLQEVDPTLYLHRSGRELETVNFGGAQLELLDACTSGHCFT